MRRSLVTPAVFALVAGLPGLAAAQGSSDKVRTTFFADVPGRDGNRAVLGIDTRSGSLRDSLGLLVTDVTPGGPADKAGIEEGDRIVSANGIDLRLSAADAADHEMSGLMARRLAHAIGKLKAGDVVELRVYHNGQITTTKVTTAKASDVFTDGAMLRVGALDRDVERELRDATASLRDAMPRLKVERDDLGPEERELKVLRDEVARLRPIGPDTFEFGPDDAPAGSPPPRVPRMNDFMNNFMVDAGPHRI
jgi:hypothetical protein